MILPASNLATLVLLVASMVCWGSWANTQKLAGKWRFELYYCDFALGFLLLVIGAAFTFGSFNSSELTFQENFLIAGYRNMAYAIAAGIIFNFGNLFLTAAVSVAGLAVAFPIALGMALLVSTVVGLISGAHGSVLLSVAGAGLVLIALVVDTYAYSSHLDALAEASKKAALQVDPKSKRAPRAMGSAKAVVLGVVSGIALGLFQPLVDMARQGDGGVAPYGLALLFSAGLVSTTVVLSPFFLTFPVSGGPIQFRDYFGGSGGQHFLGLFGGVLAGGALLAGFITAGAPAPARVSPTATFALSQGGAIVAALWGLLAWREFKGAGHRTQSLFAGVLVLFAAGIAMISVGQE